MRRAPALLAVLVLLLAVIACRSVPAVMNPLSVAPTPASTALAAMPELVLSSTPTQRIEYVTGSWHVRGDSSASGSHVCFIENEYITVLDGVGGWLKITACGGGWVSAKAILRLQ